MTTPDERAHEFVTRWVEDEEMNGPPARAEFVIALRAAADDEREACAQTILNYGLGQVSPAVESLLCTLAQRLRQRTTTWLSTNGGW